LHIIFNSSQEKKQYAATGMTYFVSSGT